MAAEHGGAGQPAPPYPTAIASPLPSEIWRAAKKKENTMHQIQWRDQFNIGVEVIDQAHRRLFAIVQKILDLCEERHEDKYACVEGIKYFKAYALKHFAEEEAYMRRIGYPGYLAHKRIHDRMEWETLPHLEQSLYDSDFSTEMVHHFIQFCIEWLTGHILTEDRAIIGAGRAFPEPDQASAQDR